MAALRTVLLSLAFVAVLFAWTLAYMTEGALDQLLVRIVKAFPEVD